MTHPNMRLIATFTIDRSFDLFALDPVSNGAIQDCWFVAEFTSPRCRAAAVKAQLGPTVSDVCYRCIAHVIHPAGAQEAMNQTELCAMLKTIHQSLGYGEEDQSE